MSSTILLIVLLSAHITGLISEQLLKAAVGESVLFPCSLHDNGDLIRVYWQEGGQHFFLWDDGKITKDPSKYKNRIQFFDDEFSSGNISFRLDNISPEDDQKTFFAYVKFDGQIQSERRCESRLQVSAPYQHLVLTVNHTTNSATCSARGGYPAAQVSWKGLNRSSDEEQDLQDAETFLQQDPTEKTFSFTRSVNITGLKSVTCIVYNPHSHESITETKKIDPDPPGVWITTPTFSTPSQEENERHHFLIIAPFVLVILVILVIAGAVLFYLWYKKQSPVPGPVLELNPEPDVPNLQDAVQEEAPDLNPDAAREPVDPNPQDPVQEEAPAPDQAPGPDQDQDPDQAPGPDQDQDPDQAPGPDQDQDQDPDQAPGPDQDQDPDQAPGPDQDQDQAPGPDQDQAQGPDQDQDPDQAPGPDQDQDPDQAPGPDQDQAPGPDQDQDPDQAPGPDQDQDQDPDQAPGPDQDQDQDPDQAPANQPPAEHDPQDGAEAEAADPSEDTVLLSKDRAVFHCQTKTSEGTADRDTCEDAAASPEKEKLLEKENGNEDSASD